MANLVKVLDNWFNLDQICSVECELDPDICKIVWINGITQILKNKLATEFMDLLERPKPTNDNIVCFSGRCINLNHVKTIIFEKNGVIIYLVDGSHQMLKENAAFALEKALQLKGIATR